METIGDQLDEQMGQIKMAYNRAIKELRKTCKTNEEFYHKMNELDSRMEEALLTDDERKMMNAIKGQLKSAIGGAGNVRMIMM